MELRPGYKQTEAGVIPEDWNIRAFEEVAILERGKFSARPRNDPKFFGGDIPFIQTGDVANANGDITKFSQTLNSAGLKVSKLFPSGTLFFTIAANIGDVGFTSFDTACPDSLIGISPNRQVDKRWLYHELKRKKKVFEGLATQNAQLNISLEKLRPFLLSIPPFEEQRAIATALSDVDALISGLDQLIAKKRDIKQATMQQLLTGRTRLPGFHGEWEKVRLGDLFNFKNGLNKAKSFFGYGIPIVNYMDVYGNAAIMASALEGRVSLTKPELKNFDVKKGDVFFTRTSETTAEIGIASVMLDTPTDTVFSGFLLRARPIDGRLNDGFKAYCFRSTFVRDQIVSKASYTTRALTNGKILSEILLPLPRLAEQAAIASVLSDMDAEIAALERRRDKTRHLKQGMVQELLTGRIRLI